MNYWNALFYSKADYAGFAVPASEGGRGPENAREVLGLEFDHHAGMKVCALRDGETPEECAYRYVRETHDALTDDNHAWTIVKVDGPDHWMSNCCSSPGNGRSSPASSPITPMQNFGGCSTKHKG